MDMTFGGRLRQQREAQQISLAAIAADTKIKLSLLEGLERDDLSRWPQRIYRRAYVRSYARAIGLDPETVVREFLELYPDPVEPSPEDLSAAVDASNGMSSAQSGTIFRRLVSSAIGAVPAFLQRSDRSDNAPAPQPSPATRASTGPAASARETASQPGTWRAEERDSAARGTAPGRTADTPHLGELTLDGDSLNSGDAAVGNHAVGNDAGSHPLASDYDFRASDIGTDDADARVTYEPGEPATFDQFARTPDDGSRRDFSLTALAGLCTRLGQVVERRELLPVLEEASRLLDAVGLIVWAWDRDSHELRASVAHGYSDAVLAQWPGVPLDAENGIASAFRSASPCVVDGGGGMTGAVVVPLLGPHACAGVLALELRNGGERHDTVQAAATILAAQLVALLGPAPVAQTVNS